MPGYEWNPVDTTATIPVLKKGEYEFVVGEPRSFMRKNQKGADSFGVRFPLVLAEDQNGHKKGTRIFFNTYQQSEGAQAIAKQFLMAVHGYKRDEDGEEQFNMDWAGKDWGYNTDNGTVGDAWMEVKGKRVAAALDVQPAKDANGKELDPPVLQQSFPAGCFFPIK